MLFFVLFITVIYLFLFANRLHWMDWKNTPHSPLMATLDASTSTGNANTSNPHSMMVGGSLNEAARPQPLSSLRLALLQCNNPVWWWPGWWHPRWGSCPEAAEHYSMSERDSQCSLLLWLCLFVRLAPWTRWCIPHRHSRSVRPPQLYFSSTTSPHSTVARARVLNIRHAPWISWICSSLYSFSLYNSDLLFPSGRYSDRKFGTFPTHPNPHFTKPWRLGELHEGLQHEYCTQYRCLRLFSRTIIYFVYNIEFEFCGC